MICDLKKGFNFGEESPPLPIPEFHIGQSIPLNDSNRIRLLHFSAVELSGQGCTTLGLEGHDHRAEFLLSKNLLKRVDFPTFGRPTMATMFDIKFCLIMTLLMGYSNFLSPKIFAKIVFSKPFTINVNNCNFSAFNQTYCRRFRIH